MFTPDHIVLLLTHYGYLILFPIAVIEGPIISVIAGFLVSKGLLNFFFAYLVLLAGDLGGDMLYYAVGRWGGMPFIKRWGPRLGLNPARVAQVDKHFVDHGGKTLLFGKWTQTVGAPILVSAGIVRMPFWKYMWYNTLGSLPKSLLLITLGFYFGQTYNQWSHYIDEISWALFGAVVIGFVLYYYFKKKK